MIDFSMAGITRINQKLEREFNLRTMRPIARYYDENEHEDISDEHLMEIEEGRTAIDSKIAALPAAPRGISFQNENCCKILDKGGPFL